MSEDTTELMDYAKELKLLELIKDRIEVSNHWLVEIMKVLREIQNEGYKITIPEDQQKVSKGSETETIEKIQEKVLIKKKSPGFGVKKDVSDEDKADFIFEEITAMDKSIMVKNKSGQVAFIGNSLVKDHSKTKLWLTTKAKHWFTEEKIKWKEDDY